jgi:hypothetical protein
MLGTRSGKSDPEWLLRRGRRYVVWRYGVLWTGIPSAVLTAVIYDATSTHYWSNGQKGSFLVLLMSFLLGIGLIGGYGIGAWEWRSANRRLKQ